MKIIVTVPSKGETSYKVYKFKNDVVEIKGIKAKKVKQKNKFIKSNAYNNKLSQFRWHTTTICN